MKINIRNTVVTATRASNIFYRICSMIAVSTAVMMMLTIVANAVTRSLFSAPIDGTNEVVTYWYMPGLALIGFILAEKSQDHTEARVLFDRLPSSNRREVGLVGQLFSIAVFIAFAWYGLQEAMKAYELGLTGGVGGLIIWPVMFLVPICFVTMTVQMAVRMKSSFFEHDKSATPQYAGKHMSESGSQ